MCLAAATVAFVLVAVTDDLLAHDQPLIYREYVSPGNTVSITASGTPWYFDGLKRT